MADSQPQLSLETLQARWPQTVDGALGIELVALEEDRVVLEMAITDRVRQPMGLLHGGVSMVLAESAASLHACWGIDLSEKVPVGIEINGSHLRSASEGRVQAIGTVIGRSGSFVVHQVEIRHLESGRLLSTARVRNYYKPSPK